MYTSSREKRTRKQAPYLFALPSYEACMPNFRVLVFGAHATTMPENGRRAENGQAPKNPYGIRGRGKGGDTGRTCEHRVAKRVNRNSPLRVSACLECLHLYQTLEEGGRGALRVHSLDFVACGRSMATSSSRISLRLFKAEEKGEKVFCLHKHGAAGKGEKRGINRALIRETRFRGTAGDSTIFLT